jgi:small subunit ribosomal protein S1
MNRLEVGEVVVGNVRGIKPYGAFIDIGGVSGLLHISEISHDHIDTPHSVFNVNDEVKVMIIDLDAERGRISLSTKQLEPEPGDMLKDRQVVYDKAEEMAVKYREQMLAKQQGTTVASSEPEVSEEDIPPAVEVDEDLPAAVEVEGELPAAVEVDEDLPAAVEVDEDLPAAVEVEEQLPAAVEVDEDLPAAVEVDEDLPAAVEVQGELSAAVEEV